MGDARKHNSLFYEHNPTDPKIETLKTAKAVNEDPACLHVGSHRRSNQPNLKNNDEKCKDYCKADTT